MEQDIPFEEILELEKGYGSSGEEETEGWCSGYEHEVEQIDYSTLNNFLYEDNKVNLMEKDESDREQ